MIHYKNLDWNEQPSELEKYKKGQTITAKILEISEEKSKIRCGIRELKPDPFTNMFGEKKTRIKEAKWLLTFADLITLLFCFFVLISSKDYVRRNGIDKIEYPTIILASILGMFLMISSYVLIVLFV